MTSDHHQTTNDALNVQVSDSQQSGKVIIFSAPSGSGKTTLAKHCLQHFSQLEFSVSCTTRNPRGDEQDGRDYYFISLDEFKSKIENQEFIEFEEVYTDIFYGTLKSEVDRIWNAGKVVIFDVDVKGGIALKNYFKEHALSIFIRPPSVEELERRLMSRGTDSIETIRTRVEKAAYELGFENQFDKVLINTNLIESKNEIEKLIHDFI